MKIDTELLRQLSPNLIEGILNLLEKTSREPVYNHCHQEIVVAKFFIDAYNQKQNDESATIEFSRKVKHEKERA